MAPAGSEGTSAVAPTDRPSDEQEDDVRLEVEREAAAPREVVWSVLTEWERQPEWMLDAVSVQVLTPQRTGTGVTILCPTKLLGVTVDDVMRVTGWDAPHRLEVVHLGRIITGSGAFVLEELGVDRTRITWWEQVTPPLGALGEWGASTFVLPTLRRIFGRSLARFVTLAEQDATARRSGG